MKFLYRKKFYTRVIIVVSIFLFCLLCSALLSENLEAPLVSQLTELNTCPACYGTSACSVIHANKIVFEKKQRWTSLFNAKNVFYGFTKANRKVVMKKLAHDWELKNFDAELCQKWNLNNDCKPRDLINSSNVFDKIVEAVGHNLNSLQIKPQKGLIMCPYPQLILELINLIVRSGRQSQNIAKLDWLYIWTALVINPEPLILQILKKSDGWPVPVYIGVCGRLEIVSHEGEPLYSLIGQPYKKKLMYAKQIIEAALDFTNKHEKYRFYLMDWSIDNIVADKNNNICFVDLEDVIILDKQMNKTSKDLPEWLKRYDREDLGPGFSFSIYENCNHYLSDHNLWAACYLLAGDDRPFLLPVPTDINTLTPHLYMLLNECLNNYKVNRFRTISQLKLVIDNILSDKRIR